MPENQCHGQPPNRRGWKSWDARMQRAKRHVLNPHISPLSRLQRKLRVREGRSVTLRHCETARRSLLSSLVPAVAAYAMSTSTTAAVMPLGPIRNVPGNCTQNWQPRSDRVHACFDVAERARALAGARSRSRTAMPPSTANRTLADVPNLNLNVTATSAVTRYRGTGTRD